MTRFSEPVLKTGKNSIRAWKKSKDCMKLRAVNLMKLRISITVLKNAMKKAVPDYLLIN